MKATVDKRTGIGSGTGDKETLAAYRNKVRASSRVRIWMERGGNEDGKAWFGIGSTLGKGQAQECIVSRLLPEWRD